MSEKHMEPETQAAKTTRERLRASRGRKYKKIENVPEVGDVWIQNLTAEEQLAIPSAGRKDLDVMLDYIIRCVVEEDKSPVFRDCDEDRRELLEFDPRALATISAEVREFCGLGIGVKESAKN